MIATTTKRSQSKHNRNENTCFTSQHGSASISPGHMVSGSVPGVSASGSETEGPSHVAGCPTEDWESKQILHNCRRSYSFRSLNLNLKKHCSLIKKETLNKPGSFLLLHAAHSSTENIPQGRTKITDIYDSKHLNVSLVSITTLMLARCHSESCVYLCISSYEISKVFLSEGRIIK